jgi:uncharacterized iron-regulated protein
MVFGAGGAAFGLDRALDADELARRTALQMEAHCDALPEDMLPGMVEAQRLRDAAMARATLAAFAEARALDKMQKVIVITGNGHAREDWGVPAMLNRYFKGQGQDVNIATLGQFEISAPDDPPHTYWRVTEAAERPDPCETFK